MRQGPKPVRWVVDHTIPDTRWMSAPGGQRSAEMTVLYVIRQKGRFLQRQPTFHDHWEFVAVCSGVGTLVGPAVELREHTVCMVPPGVCHQECSDHTMELIWAGVRGSKLSALNRDEVTKVVSGEVTGLLERMWLFVQMTPGGIGPELDAMAAQAFARFRRLQQRESAPSTDRVERAILLFHERMAERFSMVEVAGKVGCSVSCFTREFRRRTGHGPVEYLTGIRVRHATRLLETTDLKVREVGALTGYPDEFYFSRVFARVMGLSPSGWRDRNRARAAHPR